MSESKREFKCSESSYENALYNQKLWPNCKLVCGDVFGRELLTAKLILLRFGHVWCENEKQQVFDVYSKSMLQRTREEDCDAPIRAGTVFENQPRENVCGFLVYIPCSQDDQAFLLDKYEKERISSNLLIINAKFEKDFSFADYIVQQCQLFSMKRFRDRNYFNFDDYNRFAAELVSKFVLPHCHNVTLLTHLEKLYFLLYPLSANTNLPKNATSFVDVGKGENPYILSIVENENCSVGDENNRYLCFGFAMIDEVEYECAEKDEKVNRIILFETFVKGHNFGKLLYDKLQQNYCGLLPYKPINISYWKKLLYPYFVCDAIASILDASDSNKVQSQKIKQFLRNCLQWSQEQIEEFYNQDNGNNDRNVIQSPDSPMSISK